MLAGVLAAMAAVLVSGRDDWYRRIGFFAFFGAVGWSFGGSISYMQVIAYTHSGDGMSVLYGMACLFVIGFIWASFGGAGTALPAFLDRERLTEMLVPAYSSCSWPGLRRTVSSIVYLGGLAQPGGSRVDHAGSTSKTKPPGSIGTTPIGLACWWPPRRRCWLAIARNRVCWGTSLILHMCGGWWLGFTLLTVGLGLRMTPPRGDNWAGALGMMIGMFVFLYRQREWGITWTSLVTGFFGGLGFSGATLIKLVLVYPGFQQQVFGREVSTNWHSVLEQTFGFISGLGVALAMAYLSTRAPRMSESPARAPLGRAGHAVVRAVGDQLREHREEPGSDVVQGATWWRRNCTAFPLTSGFAWPTSALGIAIAVPAAALLARRTRWTSCRRRGWARGNCCTWCSCGGS